jgi:hypothetical protein
MPIFISVCLAPRWRHDSNGLLPISHQLSQIGATCRSAGATVGPIAEKWHGRPRSLFPRSHCSRGDIAEGLQ